MAAPSSVDQRVFYRLATLLPVRYRVLTASGESAAREGTTVNLSAGGMLLCADPLDEQLVQDLIEQKSHFAIELVLPNSASVLVVKAQLVWMEGPQRRDPKCRYGLRFLGLLPEEQQRLTDFVVGQR